MKINKKTLHQRLLNLLFLTIAFQICQLNSQVYGRREPFSAYPATHHYSSQKYRPPAIEDESESIQSEFQEGHWPCYSRSEQIYVPTEEESDQDQEEITVEGINNPPSEVFKGLNYTSFEDSQGGDVEDDALSPRTAAGEAKSYSMRTESFSCLDKNNGDFQDTSDYAQKESDDTQERHNSDHQTKNDSDLASNDEASEESYWNFFSKLKDLFISPTDKSNEKHPHAESEGLIADNSDAPDLKSTQVKTESTQTKDTPVTTPSILSNTPTPPINATTDAPAYSPPLTPTAPLTQAPASSMKEISINFNNVAIIEYIRFISRISNRNFVFDDEDLQFNVTIVSEEPTSIENLMAALLQELKIRDLSLIEQGNNIIIHRNPRIKAPARIVAGGNEIETARESELVTRVFRLNTLDPVKASEIIRPLISEDALVEVLRDTNNLIITDLVTNVNKIAQLIDTLDSPNSGVTIGQYVVRNAFVESLVELGTKILQPIAQGNPFVLVPHPLSNSIYIVSNSFIVEKAMAILQNLDLNEGKTKILSLEGLQPSYDSSGSPTLPKDGKAPLGLSESFPFGGVGAGGANLTDDDEGGITPGGIGANTRWTQDLPVGHIERTLFYIYKLRYRKGDQIEIALRKIAASLQLVGAANADLISTINSSQWIEASNSMIFTGTAASLEKLKELIQEVDTPLKQVFIEMLILDTTITDSLSYSVDWINRFGGGTSTGEQGFLEAPFGAGPPSVNNFVSSVQTILPNGQSVPASPAAPLPVASGFLNSAGFIAGVIGTHLTHNGTRFSSIGALLRAVHSDTKANILLNPKIITEDNNTAEIFVGGTDRYKTQSITNDLGSLITNNFQFIDVGTSLRVTPLIGNNGIITLEIIQETTEEAPTANAGQVNQIDFNLVQVLTKTRTVTKIHVPDGFFVILSGMIRDNETRSYSRIPCLGGIPIIGSVGKSQANFDNKRNLMLFIRPLIIESDEDLEDITRRQQDIYREKSRFRRSWNYEIDEGLNFLNIRPTDRDENCSVVTPLGMIFDPFDYEMRSVA